MKKLILTITLTLTIAACNSSKCYEKCDPNAVYKYGCRQCETLVPIYQPFGNEQGMIALQNPTSKQIVRCYATDTEPAEYCAKYFESQNYVRFRDIPYKTANYDFMKKDTYPTRRWRNYERTPRW